jgi:hypothetical protein
MVRSPMEDLAKKVPLYTCKLCQVRMFEKDVAGHIRRHGMEADNPLAFFLVGDADHFDKPGAAGRAAYVPRKRKGKSKVKKGGTRDVTLN